MIRRKIQVVGGLTYTVSLPKNWVLRNYLDKTKLVEVFERGDFLVISIPNNNFLFNDKVEIKFNDYGNFLFDVIYILYYLGMNEVVVLLDKPLDLEYRNNLDNAISRFSGSGIIYEDNKKIRISFVNSVNRITRKQFLLRYLLILKRMIEVFLSEEYSTDRIDVIKHLESDFNKMYHLFNRWLFKLNFGKSNEDCFALKFFPFYMRLSNRFEKISDLIYELSAEIDNSDLKDENVLSILRFLNDRIQIYLDYFDDNDVDYVNLSRNLSSYESEFKKLINIEDKLLRFIIKEILILSRSNEKDAISLIYLKTNIED